MAHIKSFHGVDKDAIREMLASGCTEISFGVETGSEKIRESINKQISLDEVPVVFKLLLGEGINIKAYFIIGFPNEDEEDMKKTYSLVRKLKLVSKYTRGSFRVSAFQYRSYHGTKLFCQLDEKKLRFQVNESLSNEIGRSEFNLISHNYSNCSDDILNGYIVKIMKTNSE